MAKGFQRKKRGDAESDGGRRLIVAAVCIFLGCFLLWTAHQLETDPTAEARFAAEHTGMGSAVTREMVPTMRVVALIVFAMAGLLVFVGRNSGG